MTPKEKAEKLTSRFLDFSNPYNREKSGYGLLQFSTEEMKSNAKQCALIAVEEIMAKHFDDWDEESEWWNEVKTEIEKL